MILAIIGSVLGAIVALFAITDNWDKVETAADAIYPLPLLMVTLCAFVLVTSLYVRERRRKRPITYREASAEDRQRRERIEQKKAEARRTVTLIKNEVASNRRLMEAASSQDPPTKFTQRENWIAHGHVLAKLEDAGRAYALTVEAYDAFDVVDHLLTYPSARNPTTNELHAATGKAELAEAALENFLGFVEGPRTRWAISTDR